MSRTEPVRGLHYSVSVGLAFVATLLMLLPYLLKVVLLTRATADRTGDDYHYSTSEPFSVVDTLGSLVYPPAASAEGLYFDSTLALVLISVWLWQSRGKTPKGLYDIPVFAFIFIAVYTSLITWGGDWYLLDLLWHSLSGFSSLRVWGRLNVILVPVLALMLARALAHAETRLCTCERLQIRSLVTLAVLASLVLCAQAAMHFGLEHSSLWTWFFAKQHAGSDVLVRPAGAFLTFALVVLAAHASRTQRLYPELLAGLVAVGCVTELYPVGSMQWMKTPDTQASTRTRLSLNEALTRSFESPRARMYDTLNHAHFNVGWVQNWYYDRYVKFDHGLFVQAWERKGRYVNLSYGSELPMGTIVDEGSVRACRQLFGLATGQRLFVTTMAAHTTPQSFVADANAYETHSEVQVLHYDGDELVVQVRSARPGFLNFIDNWDPDWRACVFGREVSLLRPFGTFNAVGIPPGGGVVRFRYSP